jgi:HD-GYP domain-containing protein (c-di-GMP phosphodiesterase class II)
MVFYSIDEVVEGMVVAESIFDNNGRLMIAAGFQIKQTIIDMLKRLGYRKIAIQVEGAEGVIPEIVISQQVRREMTSMLDRSSKNITNLLKETRKTKTDIIDGIKKSKSAITDIVCKSDMLGVISKVIDDVLTEPWTVINLADMQQAGRGLYDHSINVTIVSLCIGHTYKFSADEMKQLGLGALNYDLGMMAVPAEILEKEGALTDEENKVLRQHTVYGHLMLSENTMIPPTSSVVALAHHECQDGTGYPRGTKGENRPPKKSFSKAGLIPRFAEIVAVADAYDTLTSGRKHFSPKLGPVETFKKIIAMSGAKLNADIVKCLLSIVPMFPVGTRVRIVAAPIDGLEGCFGVISKVNPARVHEPQVLVLESRNHKKIKPITLDFSKHKGFTVELA